jgi:hypothetical protein
MEKTRLMWDKMTTRICRWVDYTEDWDTYFDPAIHLTDYTVTVNFQEGLYAVTWEGDVVGLDQITLPHCDYLGYPSEPFSWEFSPFGYEFGGVDLKITWYPDGSVIVEEEVTDVDGYYTAKYSSKRKLT